MKIDAGPEGCILPLRTYRRIFCNNLTIDGLPKSDTLQSDSHVILESYTDGILPVHRTVILEVAHYKTGKLMPIRFFIEDTEKVTVSHVASTQLGLLMVLSHYTVTQHRQLHFIRPHTLQWENMSSTTAVCPLQGKNITVHTLEHHNLTFHPLQHYLASVPHYNTIQPYTV